MKRISRLICFLLTVLLLTGCQMSSQQSEITEPTENVDSGTITIINSYGIFTEGKIDSDGIYYPYSGEEVRLNLAMATMVIDSIPTDGVAVMMFLDGQPQPYKAPGAEEAAYVNLFHPNGRECTVYPITFVPVAGQKGDKLELCILFMPTYTYTEHDGSSFSWYCQDYAALHMTRIACQETPPKEKRPATANRVTSYEICYEDVDLSDWREGRLDWEVCYNDNPVSAISGLYRWKRKEPLNFSFQIKGNSDKDYVLMVFVDGEPILFDGELLDVRVEKNKQMSLKAQLDLSELSGGHNVFAILFQRDYLGEGMGWEDRPDERDIKLIHIDLS